MSIKMEEKISQRKVSTKTALLINEAINFLAPYFDVSLDTIKDNLPKIRVLSRPSNFGFYHNNCIYLTESIQDYDIIGHEVGHWFHALINPGLFNGYMTMTETPPKRQLLFILLDESVATYSQIIYLNKKDTIQNPKFSLSELTRMNLDEANLKCEDLKKFYDEKLIFEGVKIKK